MCTYEAATTTNSSSSSRCVIRQLVFKHSLIDAYPDSLLGDHSESGSVEGGEGQHEPQFLRFKKKEDQDVFVFKAIMARLQPESLALIQRGDTGLQDTTSSYANGIGRPQPPMSFLRPQVTATAPPPPQGGPPRRKVVHFAQNARGDIAVDIKVFEKCDNKELWWSKMEVKAIRIGCRSLVERFTFSSSAYEYVKTVSTMLRNDISTTDNNNSKINNNNQNNERYNYHGGMTDNNRLMRLLLLNHDTRGFEHHIVHNMRVRSKVHVRNVVMKAHKLRHEQSAAGGSSSCYHEAVRVTSLKASMASQLFAEKLAEADRIKSEQIHKEKSFHQTSIRPSPSAPIMVERSHRIGWRGFFGQ